MLQQMLDGLKIDQNVQCIQETQILRYAMQHEEQ